MMPEGMGSAERSMFSAITSVIYVYQRHKEVLPEQWDGPVLGGLKYMTA